MQQSHKNLDTRNTNNRNFYIHVLSIPIGLLKLLYLTMAVSGWNFRLCMYIIETNKQHLVLCEILRLEHIITNVAGIL